MYTLNLRQAVTIPSTIDLDHWRQKPIKQDETELVLGRGNQLYLQRCSRHEAFISCQA